MLLASRAQSMLDTAAFDKVILTYFISADKNVEQVNKIKNRHTLGEKGDVFLLHEGDEREHAGRTSTSFSPYKNVRNSDCKCGRDDPDIQQALHFFSRVLRLNAALERIHPVYLYVW